MSVLIAGGLDSISLKESMIFFFDLIPSGLAQGINPAATFSCVSAKCFAGLVPELAPQANSTASVQEQGEQQEHRTGSMAGGVELLPVRYLQWHH